MGNEQSNRFFRSNNATNRTPLLYVEDMALDIYDINYIEFDDKNIKIKVGFKNGNEHVFSFATGATYRRTKHGIMGFIDKNK